MSGSPSDVRVRLGQSGSTVRTQVVAEEADGAARERRQAVDLGLADLGDGPRRASAYGSPASAEASSARPRVGRQPMKL